MNDLYFKEEPLDELETELLRAAIERLTHLENLLKELLKG